MTHEVLNEVHRWLDEAAEAMGGSAEQRRDALLELESTIYDRIDERVRRGAAPDAAAREVLASLGEPTALGSAVAPARPLVAPEHTRAFLLHTGVVFAAHFLLVIGATVADRALALSVIRIGPVPEPKNVPGLFAHALKTLLFDAGLVLAFYALLPRLARLGPLGRQSLAVRPNARRSVESALFLALVALVLNFLRDDLFAMYVPQGEGLVQVPLAGRGLLDSLVFVNLWLGLGIARDLLYARLGERRLTLAVDLAACAAGLFCLLRIVASERIVDLAGAAGALGPVADGLGGLLDTTFSLLALFTASLLAARAVRRVFRLAEAGRRGPPLTARRR
jgi:hypothetical protein